MIARECFGWPSNGLISLLVNKKDIAIYRVYLILHFLFQIILRLADIAKLMSKLVKFVDLIQVDFIKASIFWKKKHRKKFILKFILQWLEILFGRWYRMKLGQQWWKLASIFYCAGSVPDSILQNKVYNLISVVYCM